ncbi:MAG: single-stranded DNA-binding protein [Acidimicrobiales bacterium]
MAQDNTVSIVGNLTREPELRFTPNGQATATFGVAVNRSWTDRQSQERRESTSFFDVVCWGTLAENAATSLGRGTRVVVTGRLDQRSLETQDGDKRSKVEITAEEIAPSLRWATVQVTRNERRSPDSPNGEGHAAHETHAPRDPAYQRPAPASAPAAYDAGPAPASAPAAYGGGHEDEEPF